MAVFKNNSGAENGLPKFLSGQSITIVYVQFTFRCLSPQVRIDPSRIKWMQEKCIQNLNATSEGPWTNRLPLSQICYKENAIIWIRRCFPLEGLSGGCKSCADLCCQRGVIGQITPMDLDLSENIYFYALDSVCLNGLNIVQVLHPVVVEDCESPENS